MLDGDLKRMQAAAKEFHKKVTEGCTTVICYAGHGAESDGTTYMIPCDCEAPDELLVVPVESLCGSMRGCGSSRAHVVVVE